MNKFLIIIALILAPSLSLAVGENTPDSNGDTSDTQPSTGENAPDSSGATLPATTGANAPATGSSSPSTIGANNPESASSPQSFRPIDNSFQVGVTSSPNMVKIIVQAKRSKTSRILGSVKLSLTDGTKSMDATLNDPPIPNGQKVFEASPGKYKLSASRAGYKPIADREFEIKDNKDLSLNLELEPDGTVPMPEDEYQARIMGMLIQNQQQYQQSQMGSQFPYQQPGQSGYTNPQTGQYIPNYNPNYTPQISQNGYVLTNDQNAIIPVFIRVQLNNFITPNVSLIDPQTNNSVSLTSSGPYSNMVTSNNSNTAYRSGCLRPATPYIVRITNNQTMIGQLPYQDIQFVSAQAGAYTDITVQSPLSLPYGGSSLANVQAQNIPLQQRQYDVPMTNCPSNYNQNYQTTAWPYNSQGGYTYPGTGSYGQNNPTSTMQTPFGTTTWGDQTVNPINFGNYKVEQNSTKTAYFLVSNVNMYEQRKIRFVENNSGSGGLAFVPAESGSNAYSAQWYVTTYRIDFKPVLQKCTSYFQQFITDNNNVTDPKRKLSEANVEFIKNWINTYQESIANSSSARKNYYECKKKTEELVGGLARNQVTYPPFNSANEQSPILDLTRLSRVNFTPEEYQTAISGTVLDNFN